VKGIEGLKQRLTLIRTAFHGTHKGEYLGIAPTSKAVTATGIGIMRLANGKIQENWLAGNLRQQLGAGPQRMKPAEKK
jgi:predicted ester cyclase